MTSGCERRTPSTARCSRSWSRGCAPPRASSRRALDTVEGSAVAASPPPIRVLALLFGHVVRDPYGGGTGRTVAGEIQTSIGGRVEPVRTGPRPPRAQFAGQIGSADGEPADVIPSRLVG